MYMLIIAKHYVKQFRLISKIIHFSMLQILLKLFKSNAKKNIINLQNLERSQKYFCHCKGCKH